MKYIKIIPKTIICETCKQPHVLKTSPSKFCSRKCYLKSDKCKEVTKKWYDANPGKRYKAQIKTKFKITSQEFDAIMEKGKCECCDATDNLCIDHNHATGKVRGLLCKSCNTALGMLCEDTIRINNLIKYLNTHEKI